MGWSDSKYNSNINKDEKCGSTDTWIVLVNNESEVEAAININENNINNWNRAYKLEVEVAMEELWPL